MRFIFNFFFFGLLFYLIYLFFPDAFHTLVDWAQAAFDYLRELFAYLTDRVRDGRSSNSTQAFLFSWIAFKLIK